MRDYVAFRDLILLKLGPDRGQAWLARKCGFSQGSISRYLSGKVNPPYEKVLKIARVLQMSKEELQRLVEAAGYPYQDVPLATEEGIDINYKHYPSFLREKAEELIQLQSMVSPQDPQLAALASSFFEEFEVILDECRHLQEQLHDLRITVGPFWGLVELLAISPYPQDVGQDKVISLRRQWTQIVSKLTDLEEWSGSETTYVGKECPIVKNKDRCVNRDWAVEIHVCSEQINQELAELSKPQTDHTIGLINCTPMSGTPLYQLAQRFQERLGELTTNVSEELRDIAAEMNKWSQRVGGLEKQEE